MTPISIIETDVEWFLRAINAVEKNLRKSIEFLSEMSSYDVTETIRESTNIHYQSVLVRYFQEFLDECYLQILIDAIENGNPHKIKLIKSQIKIDFASHMPEPNDEDDYTIDSALTIRFFISDMWKAYKWEPFNNKMNMLFKSIDYKIDSDFSYEIRKQMRKWGQSKIKYCSKELDKLKVYISTSSFPQVRPNGTTLKDITDRYSGSHYSAREQPSGLLCI